MVGFRHFALVSAVLGFAAGVASAADGPAALPAVAPQQSAATPPAAPPSPLACCPDALTTRCPSGPQGWWASADYTFGWINGATAPSFVDATPIAGTPTTTLVSGDNINGGYRNGLQLRGGFWLDDRGTYGIDMGMIYLGALTQRSQVGDIPGFVVTRPYLNSSGNVPDFSPVSVPGLLSGRVTVDAVSSDFWGADLSFRKLICCDCNGRLDWLVGYRFLYYGDAVRVNEDLRPLPPLFPAGTRVGVSDAFTAQNQFHGALFALAGEYQFGSWSIQGRGGVSFGGTFRRAAVSGATTVETSPGASATAPGGLLALSSNSGSFSASDWVFLPEASVRVGYQVTSQLRVYAGYSFIYWPAVYRAADQIDPVVNPGLLPPPVVQLNGEVRPLFPDRQSSLWVHGATIGLELRY